MSKKLTTAMRHDIAEAIAVKSTEPMNAEVREKRKSLSARLDAELIAPYIDTLDSLPDHLKIKKEVGQLVNVGIKLEDKDSQIWITMIVGPSGYFPLNGDYHRVSLGLYEEFRLLSQMEAQTHKAHWNIRNEILHNLKSVMTVKKLVELWPEAAEFVTTDDGAGVEVPLSSIVNRHVRPALCAPEVVAG